jgi:hypothetical protein
MKTPIVADEKLEADMKVGWDALDAEAKLEYGEERFKREGQRILEVCFLIHRTPLFASSPLISSK